MLQQYRGGLSCVCIAASVTGEQPQGQISTSVAAEVDGVIQELMIAMSIAPPIGALSL